MLRHHGGDHDVRQEISHLRDAHGGHKALPVKLASPSPAIESTPS